MKKAIKHPTQKSGDKILLVVEGKNTEPIYFAELKGFYAKIKGRLEITAQGNPDIFAMIELAKKRLLESRKSQRKSLSSPLGFDMAYIVIDRDHFANEPGGMEKLSKAFKDIRPKDKIRIILSSPCFEYWFFLHFFKERPGNANDRFSKLETTLKSRGIIPPKSNCLREKGERDTRQMLNKLVRQKLTQTACENSKWAGKQCAEENLWDRDPHTCMHELIEGLDIL